MNDHDRRRAVDHGPAFPAGLVNHPVVPARATDGKARNIEIASAGEKEEVTAGWLMKLSLCFYVLAKTGFPAGGEFDALGYIQIPALAEEYEIFHLFLQ